MKKVTTTIKVLAALLVGATIVTLTGCSDISQQEKIKSLQTELDKYKADEALQDKRLAFFDTLDFDFYSNQKWNMFNHIAQYFYQPLYYCKSSANIKLKMP